MTGSESFYVQRMGTETGPFTIDQLAAKLREVLDHDN